MSDVIYHELTYTDAVLRMIFAMIIGIVVGAERGRNHRPAGMRTHMLVALGACVVMIVGNLLFIEFSPLGAAPDPARLGAQVISGVGFLGAGTILREGLAVKGLTTAASIWTVACLGLAIGAGYYAIALTGAVAVYATLTIFEVVQRRIYPSRHATLVISLECQELPAVMHALNRCTTEQNATLSHVQFDEQEPGVYRVSSTIVFRGTHPELDQAVFLEKLGSSPDLSKLETTQY